MRNVEAKGETICDEPMLKLKLDLFSLSLDKSVVIKEEISANVSAPKGGEGRLRTDGKHYHLITNFLFNKTAGSS